MGGEVVERINVLGFAGSLRRGSFNRGLIRAAAASAPSGVIVEIYDLADIPLYNQDVEDAGEPDAVVAWKRAIRSADALLVATPEYNHGIPGVLKNAIDWASRPRMTSPLPRQARGHHGSEPGDGVDRPRPGATARDIRVHGGVRDAPARAHGRRGRIAFRRRRQPHRPGDPGIARRARRGPALMDRPTAAGRSRVRPQCRSASQLRGTRPAGPGTGWSSGWARGGASGGPSTTSCAT